ncbi:MAG: hypothetical protein ABII20_07230 [Candidatus Omnitrophota bacterium]|nr:hypothetical protein [Candidatus Omnitrophota bacterium]MBU2528512.1 hypothetical protein [bacterium]MBU3929894.1 hypothetical protein [bacterium]MBU4122364.1 hypothetical protein [bacterium]MDO9513290.1 hypothetical protein [Elusimicrobiota bacterium]
MEILKGVLKEELSRLQSLKKSYENKLKKLIKGCLIKKEIKGNVYYYLNYRDGQKAIFKFLGRPDKGQLAQLRNDIDERRKIRRLHIQVKKDIAKMEKMVYGKKK